MISQLTIVQLKKEIYLILMTIVFGSNKQVFVLLSFSGSLAAKCISLSYEP